MDEEELADAHEQSLGTHAPYDTFGREAAQKAQAAAREGAAAAVPGLALAGWVEPVPDSIGRSNVALSGIDFEATHRHVTCIIDPSVSKRSRAPGMSWHRALQTVVGAAAPQEPMFQVLSCGTRSQDPPLGDAAALHCSCARSGPLLQAGWSLCLTPSICGVQGYWIVYCRADLAPNTGAPLRTYLHGCHWSQLTASTSRTGPLQQGPLQHAQVAERLRRGSCGKRPLPMLMLAPSAAAMPGFVNLSPDHG